MNIANIYLSQRLLAEDVTCIVAWNGELLQKVNAVKAVGLVIKISPTVVRKSNRTRAYQVFLTSIAPERASSNLTEALPVKDYVREFSGHLEIGNHAAKLVDLVSRKEL